jgi:hypothetical protein
MLQQKANPVPASIRVGFLEDQASVQKDFNLAFNLKTGHGVNSLCKKQMTRLQFVQNYEIGKPRALPSCYAQLVL